MEVRQSAPAARNVLRVLTYLARQRGPVQASVIARDLDIPRSAVYRLLEALVDLQYVIHYPEDRRYGLGYAAFELSSGFSRQEPLTKLATPIIAALVDRIGETAHLAVLDGADVIYLIEQRAPRRPILITDVGVRLSSRLTASGRSLLAALPGPQLRALFSSLSDLPDDGSGLTSMSLLRRELSRIAGQGYATEEGNVTEGFASVAVAVRDRTGWPAASITVTFPRENLPLERRSILADQIRLYANELGRRLRGS